MRTRFHRISHLLSDFYWEIFLITVPVFELFRKEIYFSWNMERQLMMNELKRRITEAPVLNSPDFSPFALPIVLNVDASTTIGWGAVLSQHQADGTIKPAHFKSEKWSTKERKYDSVKLECGGLF
jgi:hypothetical protein